MIFEKKTANAMGGKTARACDSCLRKRARWYCASDDAFLCQGCDVTVHSANQLASRHERVRLEITASSNKTNSLVIIEDVTPAWHQGFTRKARTPRHNKSILVQQLKEEEKAVLNPLPFVPEIGSEEASPDDENEAQLLYRVPIFDPFAAELCHVSNEVGNAIYEERTKSAMGVEARNIIVDDDCVQGGICDFDDIPGFLPSDMDLAEFAADVESLLGRGLDEDSCDIKELGLLDCKEEEAIDACFGGRIMKVKDEDVETVTTCHFDPVLDMARETLDWDFDYESPVGGEEEEAEKVVAMPETTMNNNLCAAELRRKISLTLNYEAVITAWASQGSPWTTGNRPELNPDDYWLDFMGACPTNVPHPFGDSGAHVGGDDGGREARVSRYREKRRTRLFSKKIRYEVRKLNAEKRPRMKGRFVKRTSFVGTAFPYLN